jgi:hypothetical protein
VERFEGSPLIVALTVVASSGSWAQAQQPIAPTDDRYRFTAGASEEQSVVLSRTGTGVGWRWVEPAAGEWGTALIGARSAGAEMEPRVELSAGGESIQQYFDPHALGLRYPRIPEVDYFRRGVRSEELFFVNTKDGVRALVRWFLTDLEGAH